MWSIRDRGKREGAEAKGRARVSRRAARRLTVFCLLPFAFGLSGCRQDMQDQPKYEAYESSRSFKDGQASRPLVEGTVARGHLREDAYFYTGKNGAGSTGGTATTSASTGGAGQQQQQGSGDLNIRGNVGGGVPGAQQQATASSGPDIFPVPVTQQALERGRERFNIFCAVCHGQAGDGDGMIPRRGFQKPPSFHEDRLQEGQAGAGHFFDVITNGWGAMPSYSEVIPAEDRWKIIAYVRALQLSRRMNMNELPPEARSKVTSGAQGAEPHGLEQQEQPHRGGERN
jgi:mono/diheme cytochrome c family protein